MKRVELVGWLERDENDRLVIEKYDIVGELEGFEGERDRIVVEELDR